MCPTSAKRLQWKRVSPEITEQTQFVNVFCLKASLTMLNEEILRIICSLSIVSKFFSIPKIHSSYKCKMPFKLPILYSYVNFSNFMLQFS